jgi:hypothetical protein
VGKAPIYRPLRIEGKNKQSFSAKGSLDLIYYLEMLKLAYTRTRI